MSIIIIVSIMITTIGMMPHCQYCQTSPPGLAQRHHNSELSCCIMHHHSCNHVDLIRKQHQKHVQQKDHITSNYARTGQLQIIVPVLPMSCCRNYALRSWEETVPAFKYNPAMPYSQIFVPTADTVRFGALLTLALQVHRPVLLTGMPPLGTFHTTQHCQESTVF
jgi:hypothetical protein